MDLQEVAWEDCIPCCYGDTLPRDSTCNLTCSWTEADPSTFLIRGKNYLEDHQKVLYILSSHFENSKMQWIVFAGMIWCSGVELL